MAGVSMGTSLPCTHQNRQTFKNYFHSFKNILSAHSCSIYNCSIRILKLQIYVYLQENIMMLNYCSWTKSMLFCHTVTSFFFTFQRVWPTFAFWNKNLFFLSDPIHSLKKIFWTIRSSLHSLRTLKSDFLPPVFTKLSLARRL